MRKKNVHAKFNSINFWQPFQVNFGLKKKLTEISAFRLNDDTSKDNLILNARIQVKVFLVLLVCESEKNYLQAPLNGILFGAVLKS